jgi:hypothetical protein
MMPVRRRKRQWSIPLFRVAPGTFFVWTTPVQPIGFTLVGKREIFHKLSCGRGGQSLNILPNVCGEKDKI